MHLQPPSDEQVCAAVDGDEKARQILSKLLFEKHEGWAQGACYFDKDTAQDLLTNAIYDHLWQNVDQAKEANNIDDNDHPSHIRNWPQFYERFVHHFGIARSTILRRRRKRCDRFRQFILTQFDDGEPRSADGDVPDTSRESLPAVEQSIEHEFEERCRNCLTEVEWQVFEFRFIKGMTRDETASELGLTLEKVKYIQHKALMKPLRKFVVQCRDCLTEEEWQVLECRIFYGMRREATASKLDYELIQVEALEEQALKKVRRKMAE